MAESYYGATDTGRVRTNNEDVFLVTTLWEGAFVAAAVIDGVGGYEGGEVAAALAREELLAYLQVPSGEIPVMLREAVAAANERILAHKQESPRLADMACVLTLVLAAPQQQKLYYAHVGDTRLYLFRDGSLVKLTHDHSFVGLLEDSGRITEAEARQHPKRNEINKALGFEPRIGAQADYIEVGEAPYLPGDLLLLCSDGISDMLDSETIISILKNPVSLKERTTQLIRAANAAGGKDNSTVVLVKNMARAVRQKATRPAIQAGAPALNPTRPSVPPPTSRSPIEKSRAGFPFPLFGLILLCLLLGGLLIWRWNGPGTAAVAAPSDPAVQVNSPGETNRLQDTLYNLPSGTLSLRQWPDTVFLSAPLQINSDSLVITGAGKVLAADKIVGDNHIALVVAPTVRYLLLDSLELSGIDINVPKSKASAVHLKGVKLTNSYVQLIQQPAGSGQRYTGTPTTLKSVPADSLNP